MCVGILNNIFKNECNYENIKKISTIEIRNYKNGIRLTDCIYSKFLYSKKEMTKDRITSIINNLNNTTFTRQALTHKEDNIPIKMYSNILKKLTEYYNCNFNNTNNNKLIAIDGTYNNDTNMNEILNMGFYDVSNGIPIDITSYGVENKNKEIQSASNYIKNNIDKFKNNIIVGYRGYYSYDFMKFLIDNDLKFIIRAKEKAENLIKTNKLNKHTPKYNTILNLRDDVRVVIHENIMLKTIYTSNSKKKITNHTLKIKNDCTIITNLLDDNTYTDDKILELYKSRWDIEVFFKYIKCNFKFQHLTEKSANKYAKMYICEIIITYIAKIIEKYYMEKHPIKNENGNIIYKINKSNLINGIFDVILYNILNGTLTDDILYQCCRSYIKVIQNKKDRTFPRTSKTPFTKWYVKGYSNQTKYMTIIDAIINNKTDELNKNLKTIAKRIESIDDKEYG